MKNSAQNEENRNSQPHKVLPADCGGAASYRLNAKNQVVSQAAPLPTLGPAWSGAVLGTSGLATALGAQAESLGSPLKEFLEVLSPLLLLASIVLLLILLLSWLKHRSPAIQRPAGPAWAMTGMAISSTGLGLASLTGLWPLAALTLTISALICLITFFTYIPLFRQNPLFTGLLPIVAPIVPAAEAGIWLQSSGVTGPLAHLVLALGWALFAISVTGALPAFVLSYRHMLPDGPPREAVATAWVPLGIMGQSVVAVLALAQVAPGEQGPAAQLAILYSWVSLAAALPMALWAAYKHWPVLLSWPAYNPTWWSATFPLATCAMGSHALALAVGSSWLRGISLFLTALLAIHWLAAALRSAIYLTERK